MPPTCFKILLAGLASPATVSATIAATLAKLWGELIWAFWLHYFVKIWTFQLPTISYNFPSHSLSIYLFLLQASLVPMANLQETMGFTMVLPWFSPWFLVLTMGFTLFYRGCWPPIFLPTPRQEEDWPLAEFNAEVKEVLNLRRYSGLFLRPTGKKPWVESEMYFISLTFDASSFWQN